MNRLAMKNKFGLRLNMVVIIFGAAVLVAATVRADAEKFAAHINAGRTALEKGDYATALQELGAAIEMDPENAGAWFLRANANYKSENLDASIRDCEKAVALEPANMMYAEVLGKLKSAPAATPQNPPQTVPKPTNTPQAVVPAFPRYYSEEEVIQNLQSLKGQKIRYYGRIARLEKVRMDNDRFDIIMGNGLTTRIFVTRNPVLDQGSARTLSLMEAFLLFIGLTTNIKIALEATVTKGVAHHGSPQCFENSPQNWPRIIGCELLSVRQKLQGANCGGPCWPPPEGYEGSKNCSICGNWHVDSFKRVEQNLNNQGNLP